MVELLPSAELTSTVASTTLLCILHGELDARWVVFNYLWTLCRFSVPSGALGSCNSSGKVPFCIAVHHCKIEPHFFNILTT